jgi:hypothetical protein
MLTHTQIHNAHICTTCPLTHTCTQTQAHIHTCTYTNTHAHTYIHTDRMHTYIHTHPFIHTHTQSCNTHMCTHMRKQHDHAGSHWNAANTSYGVPEAPETVRTDCLLVSPKQWGSANILTLVHWYWFQIFRFLASRTLREKIAVVLSPQICDNL